MEQGKNKTQKKKRDWKEVRKIVNHGFLSWLERVAIKPEMCFIFSLTQMILFITIILLPPVKHLDNPNDVTV